MRGINSESIDLIATDPPFNSKRIYNAPLGSKASKQRFDDRWKWDDVTDDWYDVLSSKYPAIKEIIEAAVVIEGGTVDKDTGAIDTGPAENSVAAFLAWMAPRLIEMRRILKPTGSIYLHCDPSANSYLKLLMDAIFGRNQFRNEIIWHYQAGTKPRTAFGRKHDTILGYSVGRKWIHNRQGQPVRNPERYTEIDDDGRKFLWGGNWDKALKRGSKKYYLDEGRACDDVWTWIDEPELSSLNSQSRERTGWSTQKPLALYERIIKASSNEGSTVLDPFCGCATTCIAAEKLNRKWIGIDIDPVAESITKERLYETSGLIQHIDNEFVKVKKNPPGRTDIPKVKDDVLREKLFKDQGLKCGNPECTSMGLRMEDIELDHRIPKVRGGSDELSNRIGLCGNCNRRKGSKSYARFLEEYMVEKAKAKAREYVGK